MPSPSAPVQLQYAKPLLPDEVRINHVANDLDIEIGPPTPFTLTNILIKASLAVVFCGMITFGIATNPPAASPREIVFIPIALIAAIGYLFLVARNRGTPRQLRVIAGILSVRSLLGHFRQIHPTRCRKIVVTRRWYWPWQLELQARPNRSFWELHAPRDNEPITLLSGLKREPMEKIAAALRVALEDAQPMRKAG